MSEQLLGYLSQHIFSYIGVFIALALTGLGVPVPEDIILLTAGYVTAHGFAMLPIMIAVTMIAVLGSDLTIYGLGYKFGTRVFGMRPFCYVLTPKRLLKVQRFYEHYGKATIFIGRFGAGFRAWIYLFAGASKMKVSYFFLMDFLAALISVPILVWLGFHFHAEIDEVVFFIARIKEWVIVLAAVVILIFIISRWVRKPQPQTQG